MKALILAAGFGKRLEPYTRHTPKPLFTLSNQPILDRVIRRLASAGISSLVVNTHHLHGQIEAYLSSQAYPIPVTTRYEPEILGTGGAIKNLSDFWDDAPFMVINSDILFQTDLDDFFRFHQKNRPAASLMLCDAPLFNQVWVTPDGRVVGFGKDNKPHAAKPDPLTFTGIQIIDPEILDLIPAHGFYSIIDAYKTALSQHKTIQAHIPDRIVWMDMGSTQRYRQTASQTMAEEAFMSLTGHHDIPGIHMHKLAGDGSDRRWYRVSSADSTIIMVDHGIRTGPETQEVDAFICIGKHLFEKEVPVPAPILSDPFVGLVFVEDLGDIHLQDRVLQNKADPNAIVALYKSVIDDLIHMALAGKEGFDPGWTWQSAAYDHTLILEKECRYFVDAFLNRYLDMDVPFDDLKNDFLILADTAMACRDVGFMHRDFQSRNIMVHQNRCVFIDFQGGRTGPLQYDLASLLYDPYVGLNQSTILTLYHYYIHQLSNQMVCDEPAFRLGFETCAITRNLQILGAFGHLSRNSGKTYFETYIPGALKTLRQNIETYRMNQQLPGLGNIIQAAEKKLDH
jgi:aminoglycoside/choline kinase family phosphotransferase/choline kinase